MRTRSNTQTNVRRKLPKTPATHPVIFTVIHQLSWNFKLCCLHCPLKNKHVVGYLNNTHTALQMDSKLYLHNTFMRIITINKGNFTLCFPYNRITGQDYSWRVHGRSSSGRIIIRGFLQNIQPSVTPFLTWLFQKVTPSLLSFLLCSYCICQPHLLLNR